MVSRNLRIALISLLIVGIVVPIFFFSFYNRTDESVIEIWYTYEGIDIIRDRIIEYENLNPDIEIVLQEQPSSSWLDKFISVAQTGESPDIFLAKGSWFGELADLGYIQPITPFLTPQKEAEFLPSAINGLSYENELWGLPLWFDSILLYYNKDLFDHAGLPYPNSNWSEIELINTAVQLTDRSENQIYGLVWASISPYMWPAFQYGFDHGPLYQNGEIIVNDSASVSAMEFIYDLKYFHRCVHYDDSSNSATQAFIADKGAMLIYGGWYAPTLDTLNVNYGMEVLPSISSTNKRITPMVETKGWGISKDAKDSSLCYDIISYLTAKEIQEDLIQAEYKVPTILDLINSPIVTDNSAISSQIKQISYSQYYPLDPIYNVYSDYMRAALQFILVDHQDIQVSLDEAQAGINANRGS
jgi:maltose-binding protein MalE